MHHPAVLATIGARPMVVGSTSSAETNPIVIIETSLGNITIELLQDTAPISGENFLAYVNDGFYEGTVFR